MYSMARSFIIINNITCSEELFAIHIHIIACVLHALYSLAYDLQYIPNNTAFEPPSSGPG